MKIFLHHHLTRIDFIGRKPAFRINDTKRFKTIIGGILSLLMIFLLILCLLNFGQELLFRENPNIVTGQTYVTESQEYILNSSNNSRSLKNSISLFLALKDNNSEFLPDISKFEFKGFIIEEKKNYNSTLVKKISQLDSGLISNCINYNLNEEFMKSEFYRINRAEISNSLCLINNNEISIDKYINQKEHSYYNRKLLIQVGYKQQFVENSIMEVSYTDLALNHKNYNKLGDIIMENKEVLLCPGLVKRLKLTLHTTDAFTDTGYVLTYWEKESYIQYSEITESSTLNINNSNTLMELEIEMSNVKYEYFRKYMKFQFVIAEVGGMFKFLLWLAFILNFMHNNTRYYETMISNIFDIEDLNKYFGFFEEKNKHLYMRYRDSIALRRTKDIDLIKDKSNLTSTPLKLHNHLTDLAEMTKNNVKSKNINMANFVESELKLEVERQETNLNNNLINEELHPNAITNNKPVYSNIGIREKEIDSSNGSNGKKVNNNAVKNFNPIADQNLIPTSNNAPINNIDASLQTERLKNNKNFKFYFDRLKKDKFSLGFIDSLKVNMCCKSKLTHKYRNIIDAGKFLINSRLDVVTILKKILDFDRFKYLVLKEHQLILLNSLSKFLLDPETVNLVDFKNITLDKLIDSLNTANSSTSVIDYNLKELVKSKFQLDNK